MKRILYLSFYFEPDLSAGSFRNSPLAYELARQLEGVANIDVITTLPNRYKSFQQDAPSYENKGNLTINRITTPKHASGLIDQSKSFWTYYKEVRKRTKGVKYNLVFASSSRLFTAYLGSSIAHKLKIPFYVDVRDIFYDSMKDLLKNKLIRYPGLPIIKLIERRTFSYATNINLISGGFKDYFSKYDHASFTFFTNGIDDEFLEFKLPDSEMNTKSIILYAGNIGEGQGLHKFIPQLAKKLENKFDFLVIGDGGAKQKLITSINELGCENIELIDPVSREKLKEYYAKANYFLMHLNDFEAFKKVLPSKIFELGAMDKPIIAGVGGFAAKFINENVSNCILVNPCDYETCANDLENYIYKKETRIDFIKKYRRDSINKLMAGSIISLIP